MTSIQSLMMGGAEFSESEEYFRFKFRFLYILLLFGALSSGVFLVSHYLGANRLALGYIFAAKVHLGINLLLALSLYSRKKLIAAPVFPRSNKYPS